jgi:deoxyribose-phosphate aldolase
MTENATITRAELARMIDHTLLTPEATDADVAKLAAGATRIGASHAAAILDGLPNE